MKYEVVVCHKKTSLVLRQNFGFHRVKGLSVNFSFSNAQTGTPLGDSVSFEP